uniref:Uncharacterized protein n=1 Tax=Ascaris lumbricoides TaxID=6252 RepID=A0A0M3I006_ASCLU
MTHNIRFPICPHFQNLITKLSQFGTHNNEGGPIPLEAFVEEPSLIQESIMSEVGGGKDTQEVCPLHRNQWHYKCEQVINKLHLSEISDGVDDLSVRSAPRGHFSSAIATWYMRIASLTEQVGTCVDHCQPIFIVDHNNAFRQCTDSFLDCRGLQLQGTIGNELVIVIRNNGARKFAQMNESNTTIANSKKIGQVDGCKTAEKLGILAASKEQNCALLAL